jgi:hypothetical protein
VPVFFNYEGKKSPDPFLICSNTCYNESKPGWHRYENILKNSPFPILCVQASEYTYTT